MTPYLYTRLDDLSFEFKTDDETEFRAYFMGFGALFSDYPEFCENVFSFNLETVISDNLDQFPDVRIGETVVAIFRDFFRSKENVIIYVCDSVDDRHLARKRKFDRWFWKYTDGTVMKEDGIAMVADTEIHNSILVHKQNRYLDIIISAFRTLNERAIDK